MRPPVTSLLLLASLACSARSSDDAASLPPAGGETTFRTSSGATRTMLTGEFDGRITWEGRRLIVTVRRGSITNAIPTDPPQSPVVSDVTIQVLIAQTSGRNWQRVAGSEAVRVADGMNATATLAVDTHRFEIPGVSPMAAGRSWVVVHVAASPLPGTASYRESARRISTYACSAEFLNGMTRRGVSASPEHPLAC